MRSISGVAALLCLALLAPDSRSNPAGSYGEIREVKTMKEAVDAADGDSLLVFDVDNTLLESKQMLGNEAWVVDFLNRADGTGGFAPGLGIWTRVHSIPGDSVEVEPGEARLVRSEQQAGVRAMVLTMSMSSFIEGRTAELARLGYDFSLTEPAPGAFNLDDEGNLAYSKGLLFSSFQDKGKTLLAFFRKTGLAPKRVIFVDDNLALNRQVHAALEAAKIPHLCFRYAAADAMHADYRREVADYEQVQLQKTGRLLSDDDARAGLSR